MADNKRRNVIVRFVLWLWRRGIIVPDKTEGQS